MSEHSKSLRVTFLGGLGEIGRNCACVEINGRIILLDCGLMFPTPDTPGVDLILPDFTYLLENANRIDGLVLTHGHEDHTGALSFLLRHMRLDVYGSALTLGMARSRVEEQGLHSQASWLQVRDGETKKIGEVDVEFIPVTHSVPNGFATAFHTPYGIVLHTGDFKLDTTPVDGRTTDLARIGYLSQDPGIHLLLSDSTNAELPGFSRSETSVGKTLRSLFVEHRGRRIIVACFASHIHRIQQVIDAALLEGRRVATLGRSMGRNTSLARGLGLLSYSDDMVLDIDDADGIADEDLCILSTGSQGEPLSALARMAAGENKWIRIGDNDVVILSAHPIPGNEHDVNRVINGLTVQGAKVIDTSQADVHVSGHARSEELRTMLQVARPKFFVPVHGEPRHLYAHRNLALSEGMPEENLVLAADGDVVEVTQDSIEIVGRVPADHLYVDGAAGDISGGVLLDRRVLAEEGFVMTVVTVDLRARSVVKRPEIVTRGWIHTEEDELLIAEAGDVVGQAVKEFLTTEGAAEVEAIRRIARRSLGRFVNHSTRRRPMIVPVVIEV